MYAFVFVVIWEEGWQCWLSRNSGSPLSTPLSVAILVGGEMTEEQSSMEHGDFKPGLTGGAARLAGYTAGHFEMFRSVMIRGEPIATTRKIWS